MYVAAMKKGKVVSKSNLVHVATTGGKYGNAKSVKLKSAATVTLKKGKTSAIKATMVNSKKKTNKGHQSLTYKTANKKVATVDAKGKITAVGTGKTTVYVFAHSGVYKAVTVTVK